MDIVEKFKLEKGASKINEIQKVNEGKKAILTILETLNAKYISDLKKEPNKEAKFIYSKFSNNAECIRQDDRVPLKDILSLV
jgi:hypothetical protein